MIGLVEGAASEPERDALAICWRHVDHFSLPVRRCAIQQICSLAPEKRGVSVTVPSSLYADSTTTWSSLGIGHRRMDRLIQQTGCRDGRRGGFGDVDVCCRQDRNHYARATARPSIHATRTAHDGATGRCGPISSLADETPECSIWFGQRNTACAAKLEENPAHSCPYCTDRMSGVNLSGREIRKGAADAIEGYVRGWR